MVRPIKRYIPAVNPLTKTQYVRPIVTRTGKMRKGYFRKPKFRTGIIIGYR